MCTALMLCRRRSRPTLEQILDGKRTENSDPIVVDQPLGEARFSGGGWRATMGYRAFMVGYESRSDGAVILTNGDRAGQLVDEILRSIAAIYQWPDLHPNERSAVARSLAGALPFVGTFTGKDSLTFEIRKLDDHLLIIEDGETNPLMPSSTYRFFVPKQNIDIEFISENDRDHGRLADQDFHEDFQRVK
jgi:hypothetical protein